MATPLMARAETPRNDFVASRNFSAAPMPECPPEGNPGNPGNTAATEPVILRQPEGSAGLAAPALPDRPDPLVVDMITGIGALSIDGPAITAAVLDPALSPAPTQAFGPIFSNTDIRASRWLLATLRRTGSLTASALRGLGHDVATVSYGIIDRYGRTAADPAHTIGPDALDDHFGVPIRTALDAFDVILNRVLAAQLEPLAAAIVALSQPRQNPETRPHDGVAGQEPSPDLPTVTLPARLIGPAERRAMAASMRPAAATFGRMRR